MSKITNETQWPPLTKAYATHVTDENGADYPVLIENVTSVKDSFNLGATLSQGLVQGACSPYMNMAKAGEIVILKIKLGRPDQDFRDIRANNPPAASACLRITQEGRVVVNFVRGVSNRDLYNPEDNTNSPLARAVMDYVADINDRAIDLVSGIGRGRLVAGAQHEADRAHAAPEAPPAAQGVVERTMRAFARLRAAAVNRVAQAEARPEATPEVERPDSETFSPLNFDGENRVWPTITPAFSDPASDITILPVSDSRSLYELAVRCENRMMWPDFFERTENSILNGSVQVAAVFKGPISVDNIVGYACIQPVNGRPVVTQITSRLELPPTGDMRNAASAYTRNIPAMTTLPAYDGNRFPIRDGIVVDQAGERSVPTYDDNGIMTLTDANTFRPTPAITMRRPGFNAPVEGIYDGISQGGLDPDNAHYVAPDDAYTGDDEDRDHVGVDNDDVDVEEADPLHSFNEEGNVRLPGFLPNHIGDATVSVGTFKPFIDDGENGVPGSIIEVLKGNGHDIGNAPGNVDGADLNGLLDGTFLPVHINDDDGHEVDILVKVEGHDFYMIEAADENCWFTEEGLGQNSASVENLLVRAFTQVSELSVERRDPNVRAFEQALGESGLTPYFRPDAGNTPAPSM